jgi:hypothetical protein
MPLKSEDEDTVFDKQHTNTITETAWSLKHEA